MIRVWYQDHIVPCCGGWHVAFLRARMGSYYDWLLTRIRVLDHNG